MQGKVSVGLSTVTGYGVTVIGFATAVVAYLTGDHSQQTVGAITAGGIAALAFAITQIGRYLQAKALIQQETVAVPGPAGPQGATGATDPAGISNAGDVVEQGDPLPLELADVPVRSGADTNDVGDGEAAPRV